MRMDELLSLEHQGWMSLCQGTGSEFYGQLMTDDAVMVLPHGLLLDRRAVIASLSDAPAWDNYEIANERIIELDDDNAVLVYTGEATRGEEPPFSALMSSVYTRQKGELKLALYQQTPIPEVR